jgi:hypothetical protein
MVMPNFFIIGAMKAGTTSIYHYLGEHPEIFMSPRKEPNFFAFEDRVSFSGPGDSQLTWVASLNSYRSLFEGALHEKAVGEASTLYLYSPTSAARIREHLPHARFIAILRDPVDRAYSNYLHWFRRGSEPLADFSEAIRSEEKRVRENWSPGWHYVRKGFYHRQLTRYAEVFPRSRMMVRLYDDLVADPLGLMRDIFRFLEVDDGFVPDVSRRYNTGRMPRSTLLHRLLVRPHALRSLLKPLLPKTLRRRWATILRERNLQTPPPLSAELRAELQNVYREDIVQLQDLIRRDLSRWLT